MNPITGEPVLNLGEGEPGFVSRATDPALFPATYVQPADFGAQYPNPLDQTEVLAMCEEVNMVMSIPEVKTGLSVYTWREMTSLALTSGSNYLAFLDGECPTEYTHDGANSHVDIKNIGAKKTLSIRDIMHSAASVGAGYGINMLNGPFPAGEGLPGGADMGTFQKQAIADLKAKEIRLAMTLVLNGEDALLVNGDSNGNSLEFDGFENWATNQSCTMHTNVNTASGTFSSDSFDRFLSEGCAKPTTIFGHPQTIQEMMSAYWQLGASGLQTISIGSGDRITPGCNFSGFVNTGIGRLNVVADANFRRNASSSTAFQSDLWAMRMTHNGDPLVYRVTQIPLSLNDLIPGCTAIAFEVWKATALVIKMCCSHGKYTTQTTGRIVSTCTMVG